MEERIDQLDYDLYFDETDEFIETELEYVESKQWDDLLKLYERELGHIEDEEDANSLRSRIESVRKRMYEESQEATKY